MKVVRHRCGTIFIQRIEGTVGIDNFHRWSGRKEANKHEKRYKKKRLQGNTQNSKTDFSKMENGAASMRQHFLWQIRIGNFQKKTGRKRAKNVKKKQFSK